jgi:protein-arginine kinase activator protein McsA
MKTKICQLCQIEDSLMYRIQVQKGKVWLFVCKQCCEQSQSIENYRYGGTWKGDRH